MPDRHDATNGGGGQGRRERRELTRDALLQAAQQLWAERGIHGASLDDVAAAAGLTKGAVYSNFTGKTDLLLALLERYTHTRLGNEVSDLLADTDQPLAERLRRVGEGYKHRLATEDARLLALLLVEFWLYGMRDYAAGWRIADWYDERRSHLAQGLAEDTARSDPQDGSPDGSPDDSQDGSEGDDHDGPGVSPTERATLAMAMDFGLAFQHLLDPDRVPAELYAIGLRLIVGPALRS